MQKKAQSLSTNTVIILILAVLVLAILIFVLGGGIKNLTGTTTSCSARGGICRTECVMMNEFEINAKDCSSYEKCCVPIIKEQVCCRIEGSIDVHSWKNSESDCTKLSSPYERAYVVDKSYCG